MRMLLTVGAALYLFVATATCVPGQPAPDMTGQWLVDYDDTLSFRIGIGGATYDGVVSAAGGTITIEHAGRPISFELACERPEVVCPSEVFPGEVRLTQRDPNYLRRVWVTIPSQRCQGALRTPLPGECGTNTLNPDCDMVCDGTVIVESADAFGWLSPEGDTYDVLLGAGVATNGFNCALLGLSTAHGDVVTTGSDALGNWRGEAIENGRITTAYAGGCLWAGDPDGDGSLEALVLGASVELTTRFDAVRR